MKTLKQLLKKLVPYLPELNDVLKPLKLIVIVSCLSYLIGVWFGVGLNQTYSPVVINVEAVE